MDPPSGGAPASIPDLLATPPAASLRTASVYHACRALLTTLVLGGAAAVSPAGRLTLAPVPPALRAADLWAVHAASKAVEAHNAAVAGRRPPTGAGTSTAAAAAAPAPSAAAAAAPATATAVLTAAAAVAAAAAAPLPAPPRVAVAVDRAAAHVAHAWLFVGHALTADAPPGAAPRLTTAPPPACAADAFVEAAAAAVVKAVRTEAAAAVAGAVATADGDAVGGATPASRREGGASTTSGGGRRAPPTSGGSPDDSDNSASVVEVTASPRGPADARRRAARGGGGCVGARGGAAGGRVGRPARRRLVCPTCRLWVPPTRPAEAPTGRAAAAAPAATAAAARPARRARLCVPWSLGDVDILRRFLLDGGWGAWEDVAARLSVCRTLRAIESRAYQACSEGGDVNAARVAVMEAGSAPFHRKLAK